MSSVDRGREPEHDASAGARAEPDHQAGETIEVLRAVWSARGQSSADLEEMFGPARSCKAMQDVGFDGLAQDGDTRSAWRAALERDGKLSREAGSVRDLVLGPAEQPR
ncbi:MAG TPA: hypothetical protein VLX31_12620 [Streptosporangiaceae bacterium]|nr:hypothetical protein [Streptosporangiaceae bacterium]